MNDDAVIVCMSALVPCHVAEGSTQQPCSRCRDPIWVAPSSLKIAAAYPTVQYLCKGCAAKLLKIQQGAKLQMPTPDQVEELYKPSEWK